MIKASALIALFIQALTEKWGYIWGTAGIMWTAALQKQKVNYMVSKYGPDWKKNADAKNDNYYSAAVNGSKWIDHKVADCSGLFVWAFKILGLAIAHGSNSIYDRYCTSDKGKLTAEKRKALLPGTAVFTSNEDPKTKQIKHGHIGLYIGNGKVIEASGTIAGVCISNITAGKWTYYGRLKRVDYSEYLDQAEPAEPAEPATPAAPAGTGNNYPTVRKGDKGEKVRELQTLLAAKGYNLGKYGIDGDFGSATLSAVKAFQADHGLTADGIAGPLTWAALIDDKTPVYYTVIIPHQTESGADEIIKKYPGSKKEKE